MAARLPDSGSDYEVALVEASVVEYMQGVGRRSCTRMSKTISCVALFVCVTVLSAIAPWNHGSTVPPTHFEFNLEDAIQEFKLSDFELEDVATKIPPGALQISSDLSGRTKLRTYLKTAEDYVYTHTCKSCPPEPSWEMVSAWEKQLKTKMIVDITKKYGAKIASQKLNPHATINLNSKDTYTFQNWGTSLCWWAIGVGSWNDEKKRDTMLDLIFSNFSASDLLESVSKGKLPSTLGLTVSRYNIGGSPWQAVYDPNTFFRAGAAATSFQLPDGTYNWSADEGQRRVLRGALDRNASVVQAFSNSPPWFITKSQSSTGMYGLLYKEKMPGLTNMADENLTKYAQYLADVTHRFASDPKLLFGKRLSFKYVAPMNEPGALGWHYGNNQEGCRLNYSQQVSVASTLAGILKSSGSKTLVSGGEGNKPFQSARFIQIARKEGKLAPLGHLDTHTYGVAVTPSMYSTKKQYKVLQKEVDDSGKPFWVSEFGTGAGPEQGGLRLAKKIINDLLYLKPEAFNLWQVAQLAQDLAPAGCGWGHFVATYPPSTPDYDVCKQYYSYKQFTAFIRPGSKILGGCQLCGLGRADMIAALLPDGETVVVVAVHLGFAKEEDKSFKVKFKGGKAGSVVATYLTDATHNCTKVDDPEIKKGDVMLDLAPQSVTTVVLKLAG